MDHNQFEQLPDQPTVPAPESVQGGPEQPAAPSLAPTYPPITPVPAVHSYTPAAVIPASTGPSTAKKGVKPGVVVAIALICAVVASTLTSLFFMGANLWLSAGDTPQDGETVQIPDSTGKDSVTTIINETDSVVQAVAQKASPSIVGIRVTTSQNHFFYGTQESQSEGSGIVYSDQGHIITNYHVVEGAVSGRNANIEVFLNDGSEQTYSAQLIGYEIASDLAVLKISAKSLSVIEVGSSADLKLGQTAIAIGNPGGISYMGSVSAGIISGLNRTVSIDNIGDMTLIQTDAAVNPGNSGGALLDDTGKLIGVVSSKLVAEEYEGIGFAIPVDTAVEVVEKIINNQGSSKPYAGLTISTTYDSATLNKLGYPSGVVVERAAGPAQTAGIQRGDVITKFNGTAVTGYEEYQTALERCKPGQQIELTIYRNRRTYRATVTLGQTYN